MGRLWVAGHGSWAMDCRVWEMFHGPWAVDCCPWPWPTSVFTHGPTPHTFPCTFPYTRVHICTHTHTFILHAHGNNTDGPITEHPPIRLQPPLVFLTPSAWHQGLGGTGIHMGGVDGVRAYSLPKFLQSGLNKLLANGTLVTRVWRPKPAGQNSR